MEKTLALSDKKRELAQKKLSLSTKYHEALHDYKLFLQQNKQRTEQQLQTSNPDLAKYEL